MSDINAVEAVKPTTVKGFDVGMDGDNEITYDLPLGFDEKGDVNAAIHLVGKNSAQYKAEERKLSRMSLKKSAVRGRPLDLKKDSDSDEFLDGRDAHNIAMAVAVTVGWTGLTSGGADFPFTPEAATALYKKNAFVLAKVLAAIEDQSNFLKV